MAANKIILLALVVLVAGLVGLSEQQVRPNKVLCPLSSDETETACKDYSAKGFESCKLCCASHQCSFDFWPGTDRCTCTDTYTAEEPQQQ